MLKFGVVALRASIDSTFERRTSRVLKRGLNFAPRIGFDEAEAPEKLNAAKLKIAAHFILAPR
jgi:hypothetical protein